MRELRHAVRGHKPLITLLETVKTHGAISLRQLTEHLVAADDRYAGASLRRWEPQSHRPQLSRMRSYGLTRDLAVCSRCPHRYPQWGFDRAEPRGMALSAALCEAEPIEWTRSNAFQSVTMRLIAQRLLSGGATYVPVELP